ncbi:MAG: Arm DNA-binding domain-containing protein, partial [Thiohalomonadales bacterium]
NNFPTDLATQGFKQYIRPAAPKTAEGTWEVSAHTANGDTPHIPLTNKTIRNIKLPPSVQQKLFDGEGLFLLLIPKGRRWCLKYRFNGREKLRV